MFFLINMAHFSAVVGSFLCRYDWSFTTKVFVPCEEHGFPKCMLASEVARCPAFSQSPSMALLRCSHLHPKIQIFITPGEISWRNLLLNLGGNAQEPEASLYVRLTRISSWLNTNLGTKHGNAKQCPHLHTQIHFLSHQGRSPEENHYTVLAATLKI